jgi:hypothetical protein
VLDNAIFYNKSDTPFYKTAYRIRTLARNILAELDTLIVPSHLQIPNTSAIATDEGAAADTVEVPVMESSDPLPLLGNLEPRLDVLETLVSSNAVQNDMNLEYILGSVDPVVSLFNYELGIIKPPPPPKKVGKRKKKYKADGLAENGQVDMVTLDSAPGFRAPRTRRATAAAAAFEAEVGGEIVRPSTLPETERQDGAAATAQKTKWKRTPNALPGQPGIPTMVENVDNQQSFKMFDAGWILPPDQKRGGRVRVERPAPLPPKKRTKAGMCFFFAFYT